MVSAAPLTLATWQLEIAQTLLTTSFVRLILATMEASVMSAYAIQVHHFLHAHGARGYLIVAVVSTWAPIATMTTFVPTTP
jgi:hypothetical protein